MNLSDKQIACPRCGKITRAGDIHTCSPQVEEQVDYVVRANCPKCQGEGCYFQPIETSPRTTRFEWRTCDCVTALTHKNQGGKI